MTTSVLKEALKLFAESDKAPKGARRNIEKLSKKRKQIIAFSEKKEEVIKNNVKNNLKAIKLLSHYSVSSKVSEKIIKHRVKADISLEPKKKEESGFTEEDFQAFEAEYADS